MAQRPSSPRTPSLLSPTSTPTSSLRPSLDIPGPSANARGTSPVPPSNARRNRAALRDYYNLKTAPAAHSSRTGSVSSAPTIAAGPQANGRSSLEADEQPFSALDDPAFSPDDYVQTLLNSSTLNMILKAESTLVSEIRTLDGERKALVYDNYSKLIRATETIGGLTGGMDQGQDARPKAGLGLGGLLNNTQAQTQTTSSMQAFGTLGPSIARVADMAKSLAEAERAGPTRRSRENRKRRQEIDTASWVAQTPERLRVLFHNGENEQALKEWRAANDILDEWRSVKGVAEVKTACEEVVEQYGG